jgi:hypothetical protein
MTLGIMQLLTYLHHPSSLYSLDTGSTENIIPTLLLLLSAFPCRGHVHSAIAQLWLSLLAPLFWPSAIMSQYYFGWFFPNLNKNFMLILC